MNLLLPLTCAMNHLAYELVSFHIWILKPNKKIESSHL